MGISWECWKMHPSCWQIYEENIGHRSPILRKFILGIPRPGLIRGWVKINEIVSHQSSQILHFSNKLNINPNQKLKIRCMPMPTAWPGSTTQVRSGLRHLETRKVLYSPPTCCYSSLKGRHQIPVSWSIKSCIYGELAKKKSRSWAVQNPQSSIWRLP